MTLTVPRLHPTAVIDPSAELHETVEVGPFAVIGPDVKIGAGTTIGAHAILKGPMTIGCDNRIFSFVALGEVSQDMTAKPTDATRVEIGDRNTIREFVTIQRGTLKEQGVTRVGNDNWIMNYVHVAHDCVLGNHGIFANLTTFAGHVRVDDYVVLGGATLVAQYCRLGAHCFSAGGAGITRDVPPFVIVQGNPAAPRGVNLEGARRRGFTAEELSEVKKLYRLLYLAGLSLPEIKVELKEMAEHSRHAAAMLSFVEGARHLLQKE